MKSTSDRDCTANRWRFVRQFGSTSFASRVNTGSGAVDDRVLNFIVLQMFGDGIGDHLFDFAASGAVADGDHVDRMSFYPITNSFFAFVFSSLISDNENLPRLDQVATAIDQCHATTTFVAGVNRQNNSISSRRLEQ